MGRPRNPEYFDDHRVIAEVWFNEAEGLLRLIEKVQAIELLEVCRYRLWYFAPFYNNYTWTYDRLYTYGEYWKAREGFEIIEVIYK
jgi:hypothetical protein